MDSRGNYSKWEPDLWQYSGLESRNVPAIIFPNQKEDLSVGDFIYLFIFHACRRGQSDTQLASKDMR